MGSKPDPVTATIRQFLSVMTDEEKARLLNPALDRLPKPTVKGATIDPVTGREQLDAKTRAWIKQMLPGARFRNYKKVKNDLAPPEPAVPTSNSTTIRRRGLNAKEPNKIRPEDVTDEEMEALMDQTVREADAEMEARAMEVLENPEKVTDELNKASLETEAEVGLLELDLEEDEK